ncbi:MAG: hypothetical protein Q8P81_03435 [Nanoarchaeota archaeon]|nr:hypothetical protein [Nanoarchaeota archaeon]
MGGVAQHLNHLYDNPNLSFAKIKKILSLASNGKLQVTEKLDGFNIALSFRDGHAVMARNKGDLQSGGMDANGILKREFAGGEGVRKTYLDAVRSFENVIKSLPPKTQNTLFKNGKIFYNSEIMGSGASNVIKYDINTLKIHDVNHKEFVPETGEIIPFKDENVLSLFRKVIEKSEQVQDKNTFKVKNGAFAELKSMASDKDLKIAKIKLDKILSSEGLSDSATIEDYLRLKLTDFVNSQLPETSDQIITAIVGNMLSKTPIPTGLSVELRNKISNIKKQKEAILKQAIFPVEEVVHDFSVELLKGFESAFILDNKKEVQRLKQETEKAIRAIQSSNNEEANAILVQQLRKLKDVENISTASEGIVFEFEGNVYKFTGSFAPMNQLLGLFKYGRGKIPPMEKLEEAGKNKVIAIVPGGFKPPHAGHFKVAKYFADMPEVDKVIVLISPQERAGHGDTNRIVVTAEQSLGIWDIYLKNSPKIKAKISRIASPVRSAYEYIEKVNSGDTIVFGLGEKEGEEKSGARFDMAQEYADKVNPGVKIQIMHVPPQAGGVSGTVMRELIADGNKGEFFSYLPEELDDLGRETIWDILTRQEQQEESLLEKKSLTIFRSICENLGIETLEEVSVKDLKAKYPDRANDIDALTRELENKYVYPALRFLVSDCPNCPTGKAELENVIKNLKLYDVVLKTGKLDQAIAEENLDLRLKDIGWYSANEDYASFAEMVRYIDLNFKSHEDVKRKVEQENEKIYEDDTYLALWIKSHAASCYYGSGTDWCITKEEGRYWDHYEKENHIVFIFNKQLEKDKQNRDRKTAFLIKKDGTDYECYDLLDKMNKCENLPQELKSIISKKITGEDVTSEEASMKKINKKLEEQGGKLTENGWVFGGNLELQSLNLSKLPKIFDVAGYMDIADNLLTSLEGCPKEVGGWFSCSYNHLKTLEGGPEIVGKGSRYADYNCNFNDLVSLKGAPKIIHNNGDFKCTHNKLTSLEYLPEKIGGYVYFEENPIEDYVGAKELANIASGKKSSLEEISAMSTGAVEGGMTKSPFPGMKKKEYIYEEEDVIEEYDTQSVSQEPYQKLMRKLHPKHKERLIGKGGQKADVAGSPYKVKPSMQRSKSAPPMGESKENYFVDRQKIINEIQARIHIRNLIKEEKQHFLNEQKQEQLLREYIKKVIKEASAEDSEVPHASTGINVLEDLLKKIIPIIEDDFKSLTTDPEQRNSFRSHIINAVKNTLTPSRMKKGEDDKEGSEQTMGEGDVNVDVGNNKAEAPLDGTKDIPDLGSDAFIDIDKKTPKADTFTIPGADLTGRNVALRTYDKIESQVSDAYSLLDNEEDENTFYDYLITNLKLYCDRWEDELQSAITEPTTPSYEEEKVDSVSDDAVASEEEPLSV